MDSEKEKLKLLKSIDSHLEQLVKQTNPRFVERERLKVEQMRRDGERIAKTFGED